MLFALNSCPKRVQAKLCKYICVIHSHTAGCLTASREGGSAEQNSCTSPAQKIPSFLRWALRPEGNLSGSQVGDQRTGWSTNLTGKQRDKGIMDECKYDEKMRGGMREWRDEGKIYSINKGLESYVLAQNHGCLDEGNRGPRKPPKKWIPVDQPAAKGDAIPGP
jgi:hypothetical protein